MTIQGYILFWLDECAKRIGNPNQNKEIDNIHKCQQVYKANKINSFFKVPCTYKDFKVVIQNYFTGISCNPQPVMVAIFGMMEYAFFF